MQFICGKFWQYLIKYKILPPFDQESLLEIYAINRLFPMVKGVYTRVFTSASFDKKEERDGSRQSRDKVVEVELGKKAMMAMT